MKIKEFEKAEESFLKLIKINPLSRDGYFYLGSVQLALNKNEDALSSFNKTLKIDPNFSFAWTKFANKVAGALISREYKISNF